MSGKNDIVLTQAQLERVWALTCALVQNDAAQRKSLDMCFLNAARFVHKVESGLVTSAGVQLDTGKADASGRLSVTVRVAG